MAGLSKVQTTLIAAKHDMKSLKPGDRMIPYKEAAERYGVSYGTIRVVYEKLESEGWIEIVYGIGTFVR